MYILKVFDNLEVMEYVRERVKTVRESGETHNKIHLPAKASIQKGNIKKNILKENIKSVHRVNPIRRKVISIPQKEPRVRNAR